MNKQLRRVSILVMLMFLALFVSTTIIQYFQRGDLQSDGRNSRTFYASFKTERGQILVDGEPIAYSTKVDDRYSYQRVYAAGPMYSTVTGYFTVQPSTGGLEGDLNSYLSGNSDEQFLDRINAIITGSDPQGASVELTIDPVVQQAAWDALGDYTGAVVAIDPRTGAILALVSKPSYDPNQLAAHDPNPGRGHLSVASRRPDRPAHRPGDRRRPQPARVDLQTRRHRGRPRERAVHSRE